MPVSFTKKPAANPRKYLDSTYKANYNGLDPQELWERRVPAVPGRRNTPAMDAIMNNFPPTKRGLSVYKKGKSDPTKWATPKNPKLDK